MVIARKRAGGHRRQVSEIDPGTLRVQFSDDVIRSLNRIEAAVHDSKHFDSDLLVNLQDLTSGKPIPVSYALSEVALITRETMKHVHATGDTKAAEALDQLIAEFIGVDDKTKPVVIVQATRSNALA